MKEYKTLSDGRINSFYFPNWEILEYEVRKLASKETGSEVSTVYCDWH